MAAVDYKNIFLELFPLFSIDKYMMIGSHSLLIVTPTGLKFIFTFISPTVWRFETAEMYAKEVKEKNK